MNRITINLEALQHNIRTVDGWMRAHQASWTLVCKVLCGHEPTLAALKSLGVRSIADSRLLNLEALPRTGDPVETWYLRLPHFPALKDIVRLASASLNTEIEIIEALDAEARRQNTVHRVVIMIEMGDLREGILPSSLIAYYERLLSLKNVQVLGIGANLGCLSGAVPNPEHLTQLALYKELLELKFKHRMAMISGGSSSLLPLLLENRVPRAVNHFRIGDSVFLGSDLINGGTLAGLRDDAFTVEADIVEIKEKSLVPLGETTSMSPFASLQPDEHSPGQRGYRAIVTVGQVDTEVSGLTPLDPNHQLAGASSDLAVINLGPDPGELKVGDTIRFRPSYGALVRLMMGKYIDKELLPDPGIFQAQLSRHATTSLPPVIDETFNQPEAAL
ncbi:MAG: alanine racemase [Calditrichaeota bacterium]|nr:alanine racemase [Candidatus Cloacimonadota bacterium]MCB1047232.1 alanine racemase [Calditrichota bacterium]MCB9473890.1 alanine racemase [Candidatus Delongbacteria bacterium]